MHRARGVPFLLICAVTAVIYGVTHWLFTLDNLLRDVACDDSFYYYKIAANLAAGVGSTFDGQNLTNGYHPAWAFLLVPLFKLFGTSETALRTALGLQYVLVAGAGAMLVGAANLRGIRASLAVVPFFYWLTRPELFIGMEGALHLFALTALFLAAVLWLEGRWPNTSTLLLFITGFVMVWVRLESLLVVLLLLGMLLWARRGKVGTNQIIGMALAPVIGAITYFFYNYVRFGTLIPVSGMVKRYTSSVDMERANASLLYNAGAILGSARIFEGVLTAVIVLVALVINRRRHRSAQDLPWHAMLVALALTHLAFTAYAMRFLHVSLASAAYYFMPLLLLTSVAILYFGEHALSALAARFSKHRLNVYASALSLCVCAYFGLSSVHRIYKQSTNTMPDWEMLSYRGILWANTHLPSNAVIGATDAGVMGFFSNNRVVNLDGLVNSAAFFQAMQMQEMDDWLATSSITHFAGVLPHADDGCRLFATRMRQTKSLRGTCKLIYVADDKLPASSSVLRAFRVYEFQPEGRPAR